MINLVHYLAMLCAITEVFLNTFLTAKIFFRKGIFGRDCVFYIYFLSVVGVVSGLSSFPQLLLLFTFNNENCPSFQLILASTFRVFTTRLQFSVLAAFAIDRFISLTTPVFYQSFPRKQPAYLAAAVSLLFAVFEEFVFLFGNDYKTIVKTCSLSDSTSLLFQRLNPLFNFIQFAFVFLGAVSVFIETISSLTAESRRLPAANFAIRWIFAFAALLMLVSVVTPLLLRFQIKIASSIPDVSIWGDFCLHVNGVILLPTINYARSDLRRVVRIGRRKKVTSDTVTVNTVNVSETQ